MTLDGLPIFGLTGLRCRGPTHSYKSLREELPGVDGYRIYRLRREHGGVFVCRGRITAATHATLRLLIDSYGRYVNGQLYFFTDTAVLPWDNCELTSYEQVDDIARTQGGQYTVRVQGVVVRAAPSEFGFNVA